MLLLVLMAVMTGLEVRAGVIKMHYILVLNLIHKLLIIHSPSNTPKPQIKEELYKWQDKQVQTISQVH